MSPSMFPSLFKASSMLPLGIDIGTTSIKIVEIKRTGRFYELKNYSLFSLSDLASVSQDFSQEIATPSFRLTDSEASEILQSMMHEAGIRMQNAAFSIPVSSSFFVVVDFPVISKEEIRRAIPFQARQFIPIALSEVVLDWKILEGGMTKETSRIPVLLVAVPKEVISRITRIAKLTGLELRHLEVETFSLVRSLLEGDAGPTLLIDIGGNNTNITVVAGGDIYLSHNVDVSGETVTRAVSSSLGVDIRRAAELKATLGITARGAEREISESIFSIVDKVAHEVSRVLARHKQKWGSNVSKFVVTGGSANLPGLINYFVQRFGLEVVRANPFHALTYPQVLSPTLGEIAPRFGVAVGLAMAKRK